MVRVHMTIIDLNRLLLYFLQEKHFIRFISLANQYEKEVIANENKPFKLIGPNLVMRWDDRVSRTS